MGLRSCYLVVAVAVVVVHLASLSAQHVGCCTDRSCPLRNHAGVLLRWCFDAVIDQHFPVGIIIHHVLYHFLQHVDLFLVVVETCSCQDGLFRIDFIYLL